MVDFSELPEEGKLMVLRAMAHAKELEATANQEPKKRHRICDMPRKYKLTEEEKAEIPAKFDEFIRLYDVAIAATKKHLQRLEKVGFSKDEWDIYEIHSGGVHFDQNDRAKIIEWLIEDLKKALDLLIAYRQKVLDDGIDNMIANLERFQRGRRPVGLSRGFREILWVGYDWQEEIMNAVREIGFYYNNM